MIDPKLGRRIATMARKGRDAIAERDALIVEAIEAGATQREVAEYAGLTQPGVRLIYERHKNT